MHQCQKNQKKYFFKNYLNNSLFVIFCFFLPAFATEQKSIPWKDEGFDGSVLLKKEDYLPENFSMHYLVSFGMFASSAGMSKSGSLFLSVMHYDVSENLSLSAAIGFSTLFFATYNENFPDAFKDTPLKPELRIPYIALDYQFSDNVSLHVELGDGSCMDYLSCSYGQRFPERNRPRFIHR